MESGNLAHQPNTGKGKLVSAEIYDLPLLPYEHDLIASLGLSEKEYREFAAEVRTRLREADFKGEPVAGPATPFLIQIAIGLVLTGIGMLLAPKPKQQEQDRQRAVQTDSQTGRTRFNNTVGFEGAPQLARLGSRIPIPFGLFVPETAIGEDVFNQSGGIIVDPLLVWSRMTSHGKFQTLKFLTVIGTSKISTPPTLPALMFGGQSLANFYKTNYWVGWSSENDENKIQLKDTLYGEAVQGLTGSPDDQIFICPTLDTQTGAGFSQAFTPANTTSFGVYQPIPNGGNWRLNWNIPPFGDALEDEQENTARNERKKIAGSGADTRQDGMKGTGRAYSTKCGVVGINSSRPSLPTEVQANMGDILHYQVQGGQFDFDNTGIGDNSGVAIGDLNSRIDSLREEVDDMLQIGVVLAMNKTLLKVVQRPSEVWNNEAPTLDYQLEVIGFTGSNRVVGIIGSQNVSRWILSEGGDRQPDESFRGTGWYSLAKMDIGQVKNTRPVEVTEIGIKAQVYSQLNGLANFNTIPSPSTLVEYDEDNVTVNLGTISKFARRTAFFVLGVRDPNNIQGVDTDGGETSYDDGYLEGYDIIDNCTFAVTGNKPVDQYCWIRIRHPSRVALEYRLIPKPATTILQFTDVQPPQIYVLRGGGPMTTFQVSGNAYGPFQLDFAADRIPLDQLFDLPELSAGLQKVPAVLDCSDVLFTLYRDTPATGGGSYQAWLEALDNGQWNLKPTTGNSNKNVYGERRTTQITATRMGETDDEDFEGPSSLPIEISGVVIDAGGEERLASHGTAKAWQAGFALVGDSQSEGLREGDRFEATLNVTNTWHGQWFGITGDVTQTFAIDSDGNCRVISPSYEREREFEDNAAIKEISPYQELSNSCDSSPEFSIAYVNESLGCNPEPNWYGMSVVGYKIRSLNQTAAFNQAQVWLPNGIDVPRLGPASAYPDSATEGPSNNFADLAHYLLTATGPGVAAAGRSISPELVDTASFENTAKFLANYWFRFDGAISDSVNLRDYFTAISPLFLCNFVILNGQFAIKPALPVDSSGKLIEGAITPQAMFNDGTIVAGSFKLTFLTQQERQDFRANMLYRLSQENTLPETKSILVQWKWDQNDDTDLSNNITTVNQEDFDMSSFCTRRSHAFAAARYMLSIRRRVDHIIEFKTTPEGAKVAPGDFIRVQTTSSPYEQSRNGVVLADGTIHSPSPMPDGTYRSFVYQGGEEDQVQEVQLEVKDGKAVDPTVYGSLFNSPSVARRFGFYQIESIGIEEDGCVMITASHHPVFADFSSKIVYDVLHPEEFRVVEEGGSTY